ncbi:ChbG/HpnK family deacetylase [Microbacterium sp. NPDC076911]|uniref:ChbG/HpnK family deacetylase n=1 Tax=Microbacterium sp. NPDC076911 TaxID=3154958 RepID=UPI0034333D22
MPQLIVQADDIAITHGTTLGILDAITNGIVRATGMFANCPDAEFAASRLRALKDVDVGIDLNFVTGVPILSPGDIPGLVTAGGRFRSSGEIRAAHRVIGGDAVYAEFDVDPFDGDETAAEAQAQIDRFQELMGRPPAYIHHHSLVSPISDEVVRQAAAQLSLPFVDDLYRIGGLPLLPNDWYAKPFPLTDQASADAVGAIARLLPMILENEVSLLITHPGFVDAEILELSSYSIIRARDLELVTSPAARQLLADAGVEVTSFTQSGIFAA